MSLFKCLALELVACVVGLFGLVILHFTLKVGIDWQTMSMAMAACAIPAYIYADIKFTPNSQENA